MLGCALSCYAIAWHAVLCPAMLCCALPCCAVPCYAMLRSAMLRCAVSEACFCALQSWSEQADSPATPSHQQEGAPTGQHQPGPHKTNQQAERMQNQKDLNLKVFHLMLGTIPCTGSIRYSLPYLMWQPHQESACHLWASSSENRTCYFAQWCTALKTLSRAITNRFVQGSYMLAHI